MAECLLEFNAVPYIKGRYYVLNSLNVFISIQRTRKKHSGYILAFKLTDDFEEKFERAVYWFKPDMSVMRDVFGSSVPDLNIIEDISELEEIIPENSVIIIDTARIKQSERTKLFKLASNKKVQLILITLSKNPEKYFNNDYVEFVIYGDGDVPFLNNIRVTKSGLRKIIL